MSNSLLIKVPTFGKVGKQQEKFSSVGPGKSGAATHCSDESNVYFLSPNNPVPNTGIQTESIQLENTDEYLNDIKSMTAMQLGMKYKLTYDSWKNMKQRCKKGGYILDIKFEMFADFLKLMGPRKHKKYTLDRIDSGNPNYSPENCRWADKYTQNQNKSNNVLLTMNGETHPVSVWASKTQQKADTLYKRIANGWSDEEVIKGEKKAPPSAVVRHRINIASLNAEKLYDLLQEAVKTMHSTKQDMIYYYDLNGPEIPPPPEIEARFKEAQINYRKLHDAMQQRVPGFDVRSHFPMLFA